MKRAIRVFGVAAVLVLGLVAHSHTARADEAAREQAKRHFEAGEASYRGGDYRTALGEFREADSLVPSPILSFNIGLCHEKLGEDEAAVASYQDYLARRPDAPNRPQVEQKIARLKGQIAARSAPAPVPAPPVAPAATPVTPLAPGRTPDLFEDGGDAPAAPRAPAMGPGSTGAWVDPHGAVRPAAPTPGGEGGAIPSVVDDSLAGRLPERGGHAANPYGGPGTGGVVSAGPTGAIGGGIASASPGGGGAGGSRGQAEQAPAGPEPIAAMPDADKKSEAKPVYKQWWFWVVVGVSAVILVDMSSSPSHAQTGAQPVRGASTNAPGAVLWRF